MLGRSWLLYCSMSVEKPYCIRELIKPSLARCHEKVKDAILMKLIDPRMASEKESMMIVLGGIEGGGQALLPLSLEKFRTQLLNDNHLGTDCRGDQGCGSLSPGHTAGPHLKCE